MNIIAPSLEIAVLVLGVLVLLFEMFADQIDKRTFAFTAMLGLATVFAARTEAPGASRALCAALPHSGEQGMFGRHAGRGSAAGVR